MIRLFGFKRILMKGIWRRWLRLPVFVGVLVSGIVAFVLLIFSFYSKKYERTVELSEWPHNKSAAVKDYLDLVDSGSFVLQPHSNNFTTPPPFCEEGDMVLIMVSTTPANFEARRSIRSTWGSRITLKDKNVKIAFVMGQSENSAIQKSVAEEASEFNDIIQENFKDSWHNQTLKTLALLKWTSLSCIHEDSDKLHPLWILKSTDDTFVNVDRLLKVAKDMPYASMIGTRKCGSRPVKSPKSKFYVPKYLYEWSIYPAFLTGHAYLLKFKILSTLLENMDLTPLIPLENIYVTGLLARRSHYYPDGSSYFLPIPFTYHMDMCQTLKMVTFANVHPNEMYDIWKYLINYSQLQKLCPTNADQDEFEGGGRYITLPEEQRRLCLIPKANAKYWNPS